MRTIARIEAKHKKEYHTPNVVPYGEKISNLTYTQYKETNIKAIDVAKAFHGIAREFEKTGYVKDLKIKLIKESSCHEMKTDYIIILDYELTDEEKLDKQKQFYESELNK